MVKSLVQTQKDTWINQLINHQSAQIWVDECSVKHLKNKLWISLKQNQTQIALVLVQVLVLVFHQS